jgi:hypothetical protein
MVREAGVHYRLEINGRNSEQTGSVTKDPEVNVHILEGITSTTPSLIIILSTCYGERKSILQVLQEQST